MSIIDSVIALATAQIGKPYVFGDEGPDTFDCSGLTQFVYGNVGITLPRTAAEQQAATTPVSNPLPGDLVFYGQPAHHVGIYLGAGKMINAPDVNLKVRIDGVGKPTGYGRVAGAGTLAAVPIGLLTSAVDTAGDWLGGARHLVVEGSFVIVGLALIGYGLYRAVAQNGDQA